MLGPHSQQPPPQPGHSSTTLSPNAANSIHMVASATKRSRRPPSKPRPVQRGPLSNPRTGAHTHLRRGRHRRQRSSGHRRAGRCAWDAGRARAIPCAGVCRWVWVVIAWSGSVLMAEYLLQARGESSSSEEDSEDDEGPRKRRRTTMGLEHVRGGGCGADARRTVPRSLHYQPTRPSSPRPH